MRGFYAYKLQAATTAHPRITVRTTSGGYAVLRSAFWTYDGATSGTVWRGVLARYDSAGATPASLVEKANTRSPAATADGGTWGSNSAKVGNTLIILFAGNRVAMWNTWRPARPWAGIGLVNAEEAGVDDTAGASNSNVEFAHWVEDQPESGRRFGGRRTTEPGLWGYQARKTGWQAITTTLAGQKLTNYALPMSWPSYRRARQALLLDAGGPPPPVAPARTLLGVGV